MISRRAQRVASADFLSINFDKVSANLYDPVNNPEGIVNLGTAENQVCEDIIVEKIKELMRCQDTFHNSDLYYFERHGLSEFRTTLSRFITEKFHTRSPIEPDKLTVVVGVAAAINGLATTLADDGDVFLCPTPCYASIQSDMFEMAGVNTYRVPMFDASCKSDPFKLRIDLLDCYLRKAKQEGLTVRGVIVLNPNNPTGKVLTKQEITELLEFCARENLHVIVDEIFALSSQGGTNFISVLSLDLPDPNRTHWLWGFSKDFGLSGYRCGILYSTHPAVTKYLQKVVAFYSTVPAQTQRILNDLLSDKDWIDKVYFPAYFDRAKQSLTLAMKVLNELDIPVAYRGSNVLFLWINLSKFLKEPTREVELELFQTILKAGLYICPGTEMMSSVPGWFRLTYTTHYDRLVEGLGRLKTVIQNL